MPMVVPLIPVVSLVLLIPVVTNSKGMGNG
jgi:hypothetical protein